MIWYFIAGAVIFAVGTLFGAAMVLAGTAHKKDEGDTYHE